MLSPTVPWPLDLGGKIRIWHTFKQLSAEHQVSIACAAQEPAASEGVDYLTELAEAVHVTRVPPQPRWRASWRTIASADPYRVVKFHREDLKRWLLNHLAAESYDLIWVQFLNMLTHLSDDVLSRNVIVLDQHNADERVWASYAHEGSIVNRAFAQQNLWKLRRFQRRMLDYVDVVLSVSDDEAAFMRSRVPTSCEVWTMPNGVDVDGFHPGPAHADVLREPVILFCGSMDVTMNVDAAVRFANRIFPTVQAHHPEAMFWIVGRRPTRAVQELDEREGIQVTGDVADVRPYYERATVLVVPFRYGAGTKLKVLEAMAMGVPVVATPVGCQGIDVEPGRHLYVEESDEPFAERVTELVQDPDARARLARAGRELVEARYSWRQIVRETAQHLEHLVEERRQHVGSE
ncbi:MAG: glycosyltransferase [Salinibacter sp.]